MPVDLSGINPIIEAMIASQQAKAQYANKQQKDKEEQQRAKEAENKLKADIDDNNKRHDEVLKQIDISKALAEATVEANRLKSLSSLRDASKDGINLDAFTSEDDPNTFQIPGTQTRIPKSAIPSQKDIQTQEFAQAYGTAQSQASGQAKGREPFEQAADERATKRALEVAEFNRAAQSREGTLDREGQLRIATMRDKTDRYLGQLSAQVRLSSAEGAGFDDSTISNALNDVYYTGNTALDKLPAKLRTAVLGNAPKGFTPLTKSDQETFNSVASIQDIVGDAKQLAEMGSYDSGGLGGILGSVTGTGEPGAIRNRIEGRLGDIARTLGKERGVMTQQDIERARKLVYSAKLSKEKNLENVGKLKELLANIARTVTKKYNPEQVEGILTKRGIDPTDYTYGGGNKEPKFIRDTSGSYIRNPKYAGN